MVLDRDMNETYVIVLACLTKDKDECNECCPLHDCLILSLDVSNGKLVKYPSVMSDFYMIFSYGVYT